MKLVNYKKLLTLSGNAVFISALLFTMTFLSFGFIWWTIPVFLGVGSFMSLIITTPNNMLISSTNMPELMASKNEDI